MFNLTRSLDRNADRTPHEAAVIFRDTRLTHRQLLTGSTRWPPPSARPASARVTSWRC